MPQEVTIYNRVTGEAATMYAVAAIEALANHPAEWTRSPVPNAKPPVKPPAVTTIEASLSPSLLQPSSMVDQRPAAEAPPAPVQQPATPETAEPEEVDPGLLAIDGVGPKLAKKLEARGVTLEKIADLSLADLTSLQDSLGLHGHLRRSDWPEQARAILAKQAPAPQPAAEPSDLDAEPDEDEPTGD